MIVATETVQGINRLVTLKHLFLFAVVVVVVVVVFPDLFG